MVSGHDRYTSTQFDLSICKDKHAMTVANPFLCQILNKRATEFGIEVCKAADQPFTQSFLEPRSMLRTIAVYSVML